MEKCSPPLYPLGIRGFLIVCLPLRYFVVWGLVVFTACSAPRQVVYVDVPVTIHDTITVQAPVPPTETTEEWIFEDWDGGNFLDSLTVEDSTSIATVVATGDVKAKKRTYKVTTSRKPDTIRIMVPVTVHDTIRVECPCPTLPTVPTDGKFPWALFGAFAAAMLLFGVARYRKKKE